jgi:hypothetical protein
VHLVQGTERELSGNIQGIYREAPHLNKPFREQFTAFRGHSGNIGGSDVSQQAIQGTFHLVQGTFREHSGNIQRSAASQQAIQGTIHFVQEAFHIIQGTFCNKQVRCGYSSASTSHRNTHSAKNR